MKANSKERGGIARRLGLKNTDLRHYRDKYLGFLAWASFIFATRLRGFEWPLTHEHWMNSVKLLALASVALLFSSQRLATIGVCIALLGMRIFSGMVFQQFPIVLGIALVSGAIVVNVLIYLLGNGFRISSGKYSAAELGIDAVVLGGILFVVMKIAG